MIAIASLLIFSGCANTSKSQLVELNPSKIIVQNAPDHLKIPSYDGKWQAMHPDIAYFPEKWNGYSYWLAMTPWTDTNDKCENPSILVSNTGADFQLPAGLTNPLIFAPDTGYNADTDLVYNDETDELWLYFFRVWCDTKIVKLTLMTSADGITWSYPQYLLQWNYGKEDNERSYALIKRGKNWHYWANDRDAKHWAQYRSSDDGKNFSEPVNITFTPEPDEKMLPWHLDVIYVPRFDEYWMIYCDYGRPNSIFFARSKDCINWNLQIEPVLTTNTDGWDNKNLYRSCMIYNEETEMLKIWYSARNQQNQWHTALREIKVQPAKR
jgi:hypothetical protein